MIFFKWFKFWGFFALVWPWLKLFGDGWRFEEKVAHKNGHRGPVSRLITEFSKTDEQGLLNLQKLEKSLEEKNVKILKNLDDEILN